VDKYGLSADRRQAVKAQREGLSLFSRNRCKNVSLFLYCNR